MFSLERNSTRGILAILAIVLIGGTLLYSYFLAESLAEKEKHASQLWGKAVQAIGNPDNTTDAALLQAYQNYILEIIQDTTTAIPMVLTDENNQPSSDMNVNLDGKLSADIKAKKIKEMMKEMHVIPIEFTKGRYVRVYYGESFILRQLRWFPYVQVGIATIFIGLVLAAFNVAKRETQNRIWAGLAKETAHQLGTPVSSLMAWVDYLKIKAEENPEDMETFQDMEHDILRLQNIADRFSKIGSKPELKPVNLTELITKSAEYMRKRMSMTVGLTINNEIPENSPVLLSAPLFEWVIENLLKNALDAMEGKQGHITIHNFEIDGEFTIDISDTGKGMPKNMFKKVFQPGFTTKKRGWGLGLSLSKRIIENYHEGQIFVKDSEEGVGTTFRIILPKK